MPMPIIDTQQQIAQIVTSHPVVLFMKGDRRMPQCGFSAAVVRILDELVPDYKTINVLADPAIREGVKQFSQWPTIPQLYIRGEFVGGSDIVRDLYGRGELHAMLGVTAQAVDVPAITITPSAVAAIQAAMADGGADEANASDNCLRLEITESFEHGLGFSAQEAGDVVVRMAGLTVLIDRASAKRASGVVIDFMQGPQGSGFKIDNPNAPAAAMPVKTITPAEVKTQMDSGAPLNLFDVRTAAEHATARIPGAQLVDDAVRARINSMDKDTMLVFHCHHGGRSQKAAESFAAQGFRNVYNMVGGIDRWSTEVDPSVPRY